MKHRPGPGTSIARRIFLLTASLAIGAVGWLLLGEPDSVTAAERPPADVVARVDGVEITAPQVAERAASELRRLEERRYELILDATRGEVRRLLVETEARGRGLSVGELLEAELGPGTAADAELEAFYRRLEARHEVEILLDPAGVADSASAGDLPGRD